MFTLPRARNENIVLQNLDDEILVYDLSNNRAFCLNKTLSIVFNGCDGKTSADKLKYEHKLTDDLIFFALDELSKENLIEEIRHNKFSGLSRREVIRKIGLASMVTLPMISSIVAPKAINAASSGGSGLRAVGQTCADPSNAFDPICVTGRCKSATSTCCVPEAARDTYACTSGNGMTDCCTGASSCVSGRCCRTANVQTCGSSGEAPHLCCSGSCSFRTVSGVAAYWCN